MRALIALTSLNLMLALSSVQAQKADRLPDADTPKTVRIIPITPSFDQRWFGPAASDRWISNQPPSSDRFTLDKPNQPVETQNAPVAPAARTAGIPQAKKLAEDTRPAQALCIKNNMRTVWHGASWRCRK